jgi:hypothetical protein
MAVRTTRMGVTATARPLLVLGSLAACGGDPSSGAAVARESALGIDSGGAETDASEGSVSDSSNVANSGLANSGPSFCTAPDGQVGACPCSLPDGGPVDVCGQGGQCIVGPICTPGGCTPIGGWICDYESGGGGLLVTTLCSRSQGLLTVKAAVDVGDAFLCTGECVQETDAASPPWVCASPISFSFGGGPGDQ